ncbi:Creatinase/aminopeptidase [Neocallimastix lanati (nom. inval.)]|jgi:curved DNA binding protein|nr:Creatinase/aminopeptidase [Neocallimastix sp. JGI-2020a]
MDYTMTTFEEHQAKLNADNNLHDSNILSKYKLASDIANEVLRQVVASLKPDAVISEICAFSDNLIIDLCNKFYKKSNIEKGIAFPTCINLNNCSQNYSPLPEDPYTLQSGDIVKVELGVHIDGYMASVAHTTILNPSPEKAIIGRVADVICAAYMALEVAHRLIKPGNKASDVTKAIHRIAQTFDCRPVENTCSPLVRRYIQDQEHIIPNSVIPDENDDFEFHYNDVYSINILMSTGDGKVRENEPKPTIYQRNVNKTYNLKLKASRNVFNEITRRFGVFPFSLSALEDKRGRLGITECVNHELLLGYPVVFEQPDQYIAHFKSLILLAPTGPLRMTNLPPLPFVHSEYSIRNDPELKPYLEQSIRTIKSSSLQQALNEMEQ